MKKRQDGTPLRDWLAGLGRSVTLTGQEQAMVAAILLSMLVGALVMHYRREYRIQHPSVASPTPRHGSESFGDR